ncbi:hypothetical protein NN561_005684 [Cricetulus griseus]
MVRSDRPIVRRGSRRSARAFRPRRGGVSRFLGPVLPRSALVRPDQPFAHTKRGVHQGGVSGRPAQVLPLAAMVWADEPIACSEAGVTFRSRRAQERSVFRSSIPIPPVRDGTARQAHREL